MSYTFGAAAADDVTTTAAVNMNAGNAGQALVLGWWYPTTLTATRGYWSSGNAPGAEVDTTTSAIRLRTDNTTDGQWTVATNITVNKWWFLAFWITTDNTDGAAWRVWVGDETTWPEEVAVAVSVARVGNFSGFTTRYIGNKGTQTLAFQGQVGCASFLVQTSVGKISFTGVTTTGTISDLEATFVRDRWVIPYWQGRPEIRHFTAPALEPFSAVHFPCTGPVAYEYSSAITANSNPTVTVNGATLSQNRPPRPPPDNWVHQPPLAA